MNLRQQILVMKDLDYLRTRHGESDVRYKAMRSAILNQVDVNKMVSRLCDPDTNPCFFGPVDRFIFDHLLEKNL